MNQHVQSQLMSDLLQHLGLCRELFSIVEKESQSLRQSGTILDSETAGKKDLLPALDQSLNRIRQHRIDWHQCTPEQRSNEPAVAPLLREIQDLIMRIIVLDRENEQVLLRKGLIPAKHLPHSSRQRPHFVADLYRRHTELTEG